MKHHYNKEELIELKRKYDMQVSKEAIEEIKHTIDLDKQIELLVKDDERNQQTIIKQSEEIERLQDMDKILRNENINLKLRINKAREYIVNQKLHKIADTTGGLTYEERKLLEILDKVKVK